MNTLNSIQTEEKLESQFKNVIQQILDAQTSDQFEASERLLEHFFSDAYASHSVKYIGLAHYASAGLNHARNHTVNVAHSAMQALDYLTRAEEYGYIAKTYNLLGIHSAYHGDYGNSISFFIQCAEYAKKMHLSDGVCTAFFNVSSIFKSIGNYVKAFEYLEHAIPYNDPPVVTEYYYLSLKGYYLLKLDQVDSAHEIYLQLQESILTDPDYPTFIVHLFFAYMLYYEGKLDESKNQIALAATDKVVHNNYQDYMDEQDIYLELLSLHEMYDILLNQLNHQLEQCERNGVPFHIHRILVRLALNCARKMGRPELILIYDEKMDLIFLQEDKHENELVLQSEISVVESIATREKQEQALLEHNRLTQSIQDAEKESAAKSLFLSSISHEIRTPIHAILGLDEMILRESEEEFSKRYAMDIQNAGKTLLGLISDILDFSKLESGSMELAMEEYNTKDMIRELINMIDARAKQKGLAFHVKMNSRIPARLFGDDLRVKQVILNILTNAVKYTQKGSITLSIDFDKKDQDSILLKISVADTGIGMKPEEMEKLSKPFERLDEKKNRSIEGTGLGMSIVTNLLKQMGSKLRVESTYGIGSIFSFAIQQRVISWKNAGALTEMNGLLAVAQKSGPLFTASHARILVVDDNAVNLKVIKGLLKRTLVQLTMAKSGKECLELCEKEVFHLILLDHRMPEMDGVEALHILRETPCPNRNTPVIALTANAISGAYDYYRQEGFNDLLLKPVNSSLLEEKVLFFLPEDCIDSSDLHNS